MKNGPYILQIAPPEYPGKKYRGRYAYEHHLVWWRKKKEVIPKGFEIHHLNGDHHDNRLKNLKLVTSSEHRRIHGEMLKKKCRKEVICGFCLNAFTIKGRDYRERMRRNKFGKLFCSIRCGAKNQHSGVP